MSSEALKKALADVPYDAYEKKIQIRQQKIAAAPGSLPQYDYNTNVTARTLHPEEQTMVIKEVIDLPDAKCYRFAETDINKPLAPFLAGQYISVFLSIDGSELTRPYAICSSPADVAKGEYAIAVKKVQDGFASDYILKNWKVGDRVTVSGPEGNLFYESMRDKKHVVGLAGGSGITPFYSMAQAIRDGVEDFSLTLLYGCKKESEILFRKELDALAAECPKFRVIYVLSDEEREGFEHGFLSADLIRKYAPDEAYSLFVCGPGVMYDFIKKEVTKLDIPQRLIRYEAAGEYHHPEKDEAYPKDAAGRTFQLTVDLPTGRRMIPAKSDESLLVALERAGVKIPSRCRSGECGFCRTRLKSGDIYAPEAAEHRRKADVKDGFIHPCCTFPVSDCHIMINYDRGEVVRKVKDMKKKERLVSLIMAIIISAIMGILFAAISRSMAGEKALENMPPAPVTYLLSVLESVTIGVILVFILPMGKWGRALAAKAGANPPSMKFTLLNSIPFAVCNAVIISAICSFIGIAMSYGKNMDPNKPALVVMWLKNWLITLPISLGVSYILAVLISPFVVQAVGLGGPPTGGDQPRD